MGWIGIKNTLKNTSKTITQQDSFIDKNKLIQNYITKREEITDQKKLDKYVEKTNNIVFRNEANALKDNYQVPEIQATEDPLNRIAALQITKWVYNKEENIIDKLKNVYSTFANTTCNIGVLLKRKIEGCEVYLIIAEQSENGVGKKKKNLENIEAAVKGNFPGAELKTMPLNGKEYYENLLGFAKKYESDTSSDNFDNEPFYFIPSDQSTGVGDYHIAAVTNIASEKSEAFKSQGIEKLLDGFSPQTPEQEYSILLLAEPCSNTAIDELKERYYDIYTTLSPYTTVQKNISLSQGDTFGNSFNANLGIGIGSDFVKANIGVGTSAYRAQTVTGSEGDTYTFTNYKVQHILKQIEKQMERMEIFSSLGMWKFATYIVSKDFSTASNVAENYRALTQGEKSTFEKPAINIWENTQEDANKILSFLVCLNHPIFNRKGGPRNSLPALTIATTYLSGVELARAMNMPAHSIPGLPVIECAEFGRNIASYDSEYNGNVPLGKIYHMHKEEETTEVKLDQNSLASHTFVTGSTGAGKSNTVFTMLDKLCPYTEENKENQTHFLVVEPAKGEYKDVFGGREDVSVYGTNPDLTPLLKINPFSFPEGILVSEHIDRLVEIFNVCWPMYAAMPAILKDAVIRAYEAAGWDMKNPCNRSELFPSFIDVLEEIRLVLQESEYSADNKGDYTGALVTRVKSLTNGINGMIFTADELEDKDLFDKNVIVDLSRVGSTETKSLIMGLLVMKLQEYRLSKEAFSNELKHVTVLEEAHNLLKRTSTEQSSESANLLGKSVEMLANSIAEMRAFGEGFIIADQAPGLLDMSVIRNTNTKIIHRLPDFSDRELVGKAANLNDEQIKELAKLQCGVAAVYQNDWIQPVLCKVDEFKGKKKYENLEGGKYILVKEDPISSKIVNILLKPYEKVDFNISEFMVASINVKLKRYVIDYLSMDDNKEREFVKNKIIESLFPKIKIVTLYEQCGRDLERLKQEVHKVVGNIFENSKNNEQELYHLISLLTASQALSAQTQLHLYSELHEKLKGKLR